MVAIWMDAQYVQIVQTLLSRTDRPSYAAMYKMATEQGEMFDYDEPLQDCACTD